MNEQRDPNDMTADEIKAELRERGHVVRGNPSKQTLMGRLTKARAGEAVDVDVGGDDPDDALPAGGQVMFIKTIPVRNYVLVLKPAQHVRDADGHLIDTKPGRRVRFNQDGRFTTDDPVLVELIKASPAFMSPDPRARIEIFDRAAQARQLRAAAAALES